MQWNVAPGIDARDGDDFPTPPLHEFGGFLSCEDAGVDGDGKGLIEVVFLLLEQWLKSGGRSIGHEHVQHAKRLVYLREHAAYGWCFTQISRDHEDSPFQS